MKTLKNPYQLWISLVSESPSTSRCYLGGIRKFEAWAKTNHGLSVRELPVRWREAKYTGEVAKERFLDEVKDVVRGYFGYLKGMYTPFTVNRQMGAVMSYLHSFDIPIKPILLRHPYVVYHNRDISKQQIRLILDYSSLRNRAVYLMLYESGMRPDTLVKLRWLHVREEFKLARIPMKIDLTSDILKCRVSERWTFIGDDGFEALKKYLTPKLPLKSDDYVFVREKPKGGKIKANAFSQAFSETVKRLALAESPGKGKPKPIRLYCLKKAFKKFMNVDEDYKKFWMGRSETSTHYVSTDVEYHRQLYAEGYANLRLYKPGVDSDVIARLMREKTELEDRVRKLEAGLTESKVRDEFLEFITRPDVKRWLLKKLREDGLIT